MARALRTGQAHPLGPLTPGWIHHAGTWWVQEAGGDWLAITDRPLTDRLDAAARSLRAADDAVAEHAGSPPGTAHGPAPAAADHAR